MKYQGMDLVKYLCDAFGPTGCEKEVADRICEQIEGDCDAFCVNRVGDVIAKVCGRGEEYEAKEEHKNLMLSAHMDEVGLMVREITNDGYLKFACVGGIDPRVLCGKNVILGDDIGSPRIKGIIASKAIHLQTKEERGKVTPIAKMYIDIGARDKEEAERLCPIGTFGVFDSEFVRFGKDEKRVKAKAYDDRAGCAALVEVMREIYHGDRTFGYDIYFAFTRCEEIGFSTARVAAQVIDPDWAIVVESTAVADIAGVDDAKKVARLGGGAVMSLMDRRTIYCKELIEFCTLIAERDGIPFQVKKYVSGGNDAGVIHTAADGVKTLALSFPTRYLHSPSCVADVGDYEAMKELLSAFLNAWKA